MKREDIKNLHQKTVQELHSMLLEAEKELFTLQLDHAQHKVKNARSIFFKRKDIARIKTVQRLKDK